MAKLLTKDKDIAQLNKRLRRIFRGLPIESGGIQRLASQYYPAYRIGITPKNRTHLKEDSHESYREEWAGGTSQSNDAISQAIKTIGLKEGDRQLNKGAAELLVEILLAMDDGKRWFSIADLGAGTGNTTDALLEVMSKNERSIGLARRCIFNLVEPSWDRLSDAKEKVERNVIHDKLKRWRANLKYKPRCDTLEEYLEGCRHDHLDAIICSGVLHHCSFPDHFGEIRRVLKQDGVVVIGDWHNNLYAHPANLIPLLTKLGASDDLIRDFKLLFEVTERDAKEFEKGLSEGDRTANNYFADFIVAMANELRCIEQRSRLFFFEALESLAERLEKMNEAGLETDSEVLRENHQGFAGIDDPAKGPLVRPVFPKTTVACVMAAAKIR